MKTFALLVLISATIFGVTGYAQELSGERAHLPAISYTSPVLCAQAISELEAAKVAGQVIFGETKETAADATTEIVPPERIRAEVTTVDVIGIYPSGDESYKSAFSAVNLPRG